MNGMGDRPSAEVTARIMSIGTVVAVVIFVTALVLTIAGPTSASIPVAAAGVIALLATPVLALLSTAFELRSYQPRVAALAVAVLAILLSAALIAFTTGR